MTRRRDSPVSVHATDPDYTRERYDVQQAAVYLCIGRSQVYQLAKSHRIAHGKRAQKLVFAQADLDAYRATQREEALHNNTPRAQGVTPRRRADRSGQPVLPEIKNPRYS